MRGQLAEIEDELESLKAKISENLASTFPPFPVIKDEQLSYSSGSGSDRWGCDRGTRVPSAVSWVRCYPVSIRDAASHSIRSAYFCTPFPKEGGCVTNTAFLQRSLFCLAMQLAH